jgi:hypothetical protein
MSFIKILSRLANLKYFPLVLSLMLIIPFTLLPIIPFSHLPILSLTLLLIISSPHYLILSFPHHLIFSSPHYLRCPESGGKKIEPFFTENRDSPELPEHSTVPIFMSSLILLFDPFQFLLNNQPNPRARDPFDPVINFGEIQSPSPPQFREKTILALLMG